MKYCVILDGNSSVLSKEIRQLSCFLRGGKLNPEDGRAIVLYSNDLAEDSTNRDAEISLPAHTDLCRFDWFDEEYILSELVALLRRDVPDLILLPGSFFGEETAVRLSCRLEGSALTDVTSLSKSEEGIIAEKRIYSGELIGRFLMNASPYCISIDRGSAEDSAAVHAGGKVTVREYHNSEPERRISRIPGKKEHSPFSSPLVIAGGRGMKSKAGAKAVQDAAGELGADFGCTRSAAMSAWVSMDRQIGISGSLIHPKVCIAMGASGAPAFYAGIEKSNTIVAVNTDPGAPVMRKADLCVPADLEEFTKALVEVKKAYENGLDADQ